MTSFLDTNAVARDVIIICCSLATPMRENQELIRKLTQAANELQELSGLVPICSSCKRVRDDEGYWQGVEAYLHFTDSTQVFSRLLPQLCQGDDG